MAEPMLKTLFRAALVLVCLIGLSAPGHAKRKALVIANSTYANTAPLRNPANDASLIAERLKSLGFETQLLKDLTNRQFSEAFHKFSVGLDKETEVLFYFAGHGLQFHGENFMVGTEAQLEGEATLPLEAYSLNRIISVLEAKSDMTVLFWDACRNNPLAAKFLSSLPEDSAGELGRGLKRSGAASIPERGGDTFVVFSAAPGQEALDGEGSYSPFAEALGRHIAKPNVVIDSMMNAVQRDVEQATRNAQRPERLSKLRRDFYFARQDSPEAARYEEELKALRAQLAQLQQAPPPPRRKMRIISTSDPSFVRQVAMQTRSVQTRSPQPEAPADAPVVSAPETPKLALTPPAPEAPKPEAAPPPAEPAPAPAPTASEAAEHEIVVGVNGTKAALVRRLQVSPDARLIAIGDDDGLVRIFSLEPFELVRTIRAHKARISDLDFTPDSKTLLTAGRDGPVRFWDLGSGTMTRELTAPGLVPYSARFNPAFPDRWVLAGDQKGRIVAWDLKKNRIITDTKLHDGPVLAVGYQPDGKGTFFSAGGEGEVKVRLPEGQRSSLKAHSGAIFQAGYGTSGTTMFTAGNDRKVKLWDLKANHAATPKSELTGHLRYVLAAAMSKDETMVASGGGDKVVNLWSTATGKLIGRLEGHTNDIEAVAFSPDGKYVVSASEDKSVRIWSVEHKDEMIRLLFQKNDEKFVGVTFDNQTFGNRDAGLISIYIDGHAASPAEADREVPHLGPSIAIREEAN